MTKYKILILGGSSIIGESLIRFLLAETPHEIVVLSSSIERLFKYSATNLFSVGALNTKEIKNLCLIEKPDFIINTASLCGEERCNADKTLAQQLNVRVVELLVKICKIIDAHLITFSTDQVFDGKRGPYTETDLPDPMNYYGRTKLLAENICRTELLNHTIIRISDLFGFSSYGKMDFILNMLNSIDLAPPLVISADTKFNPTFSDDIARAVIRIIQKRRTGIYHIGSSDYLSLHDIAQTAALLFGLDHNNIHYNLDSVLKDNQIKRGLVTLKAETDLGIKFSTLESALHSVRFQINVDISHYLKQLN